MYLILMMNFTTFVQLYVAKVFCFVQQQASFHCFYLRFLIAKSKANKIQSHLKSLRYFCCLCSTRTNKDGSSFPAVCNLLSGCLLTTCKKFRRSFCSPKKASLRRKIPAPARVQTFVRLKKLSQPILKLIFANGKT